MIIGNRAYRSRWGPTFRPNRVIPILHPVPSTVRWVSENLYDGLLSPITLSSNSLVRPDEQYRAPTLLISVPKALMSTSSRPRRVLRILRRRSVPIVTGVAISVSVVRFIIDRNEPSDDHDEQRARIANIINDLSCVYARFGRRRCQKLFGLRETNVNIIAFFFFFFL